MIHHVLDRILHFTGETVPAGELMSKTGWKTILMTLTAFLACGVSPVFAGYGARTYLDLHPPGWLSSKAVSVNDGGEVAGFGVTPEGERGFLWSAGRFTTLLPPGAVSCTVSWMNGSGDVAGTAFDAAGTAHAFLYQNGEYLDPTPGWEHSEAFFVGDDGAVTGKGSLGAFVASTDGISIVPAFQSVVGRNSSGALLGNGGNATLLYIPGKGTLYLLPPGGESATPGRMNEKGLVTFSSSAQGVEKGYVYSGGFMIFMTPPGWTSSKAASINGHSEVVGYGNGPQGERGFLRSGPEYEEIAYPGWGATRPESVNDLGQVAGSGETGSGETRAFLSSPASVSVVVSDTGNGGGASAGGGCVMATVRAEPVSASGLCSFLLLVSPMAVLLARSLLRSRVTRR
jgi:probable HAF family extracellular repeat protein